MSPLLPINNYKKGVLHVPLLVTILVVCEDINQRIKILVYLKFLVLAEKVEEHNQTAKGNDSKKK